MLDGTEIVAGGGIDLAMLRGPLPDGGRDDSDLPQPAERVGSTLTLRLHGPALNRADHPLVRRRAAWSMEATAETIRLALTDKRISEIVLDLDSSGGELAGAPELAAAIREGRQRKTILAKINATAGGPAYTVASAATHVLAVRSGQIGGLGAMAVHLDQSQRMEKLGVRFTAIRSTPQKARPQAFETMTGEARADLQAMVDAQYRLMLQAIAEGRGVSAVRVSTTYGRGRMMSAARALEAGMIDAMLTEGGK